MRRELSPVHMPGFAIDEQHSEAGLTAEAAAVRDTRSFAAILAVAMLSARFHRGLHHGWVSALRAAASAGEHTCA
ncbi:IclR family transcriptional regulator C-terminal domain-containing protein [Streptomyces mirabilis]|uniref:IclR family transcriptional regulator domain-containing protein n=1 Tax=Streptomyces mirabilis TaxID=68239 RepID=UPI00364B5708